MKESLERVREYRAALTKEPLIPAQAGTIQANPYAQALNADELHVRGLIARLGPRSFADELVGEFEAARRLIAKCTRSIAARGVRVAGAQASEKAHPLIKVRANEQRHLRELVSLLQVADASVPVEDPELERLLGDG
jgi:hypothetical protein